MPFHINARQRKQHQYSCRLKSPPKPQSGSSHLYPSVLNESKNNKKKKKWQQLSKHKTKAVLELPPCPRSADGCQLLTFGSWVGLTSVLAQQSTSGYSATLRGTTEVVVVDLSLGCHRGTPAVLRCRHRGLRISTGLHCGPAQQQQHV